MMTFPEMLAKLECLQDEWLNFQDNFSGKDDRRIVVAWMVGLNNMIDRLRDEVDPGWPERRAKQRAIEAVNRRRDTRP